MVHALTEAQRVLVPQGVVADIHPARERFRRARRLPVYVTDGTLQKAAGLLPEPPEDCARYAHADRAVERVVRGGLFTLRTTAVFSLRYYFRSLAAMDAVLEKEWVNTRLPAALRRRLAALLRDRPRARIMVVEPFRLNVLRRR